MAPAAAITVFAMCRCRPGGDDRESDRAERHLTEYGNYDVIPVGSGEQGLDGDRTFAGNIAPRSPHLSRGVPALSWRRVVPRNYPGRAGVAPVAFARAVSAAVARRTRLTSWRILVWQDSRPAWLNDATAGTRRGQRSENDSCALRQVRPDRTFKTRVATHGSTADRAHLASWQRPPNGARGGRSCTLNRPSPTADNRDVAHAGRPLGVEA